MSGGERTARWTGYAQVAGAAALWGTLGLPVRALYVQGFSPAAVVAWRVAVAAAALWAALALVRPGALRVRAQDLPYFLAYGLVSVAGFNLLYTAAIARVPLAVAAVLLYTAPAFVAAVAYLVFREPVTGPHGAAIALTLAGCALVARAHDPAAWRVDGPGLLAGLGAGLTYGLYGLFGQVALRRFSPWTVQAHSLLAGALALLLVAGGEAWQAAAAAPGVWPAIAYLGLVPTVAAYGLYLSGLRRIPASHAAVVATLEPMVAALLGRYLLGEALGAGQVVGMGLVLLGVALLQRAGPPAVPGDGEGRGPGAGRSRRRPAGAGPAGRAPAAPAGLPAAGEGP